MSTIKRLYYRDLVVNPDLVKDELNWDDPKYTNEFCDDWNKVDSYYIDLATFIKSSPEVHRDNLRYTNRNNHIIYFLKDKGDVVYVGKSERGIGRVFEHSSKTWDSYDYIRVPPHIKLDIIETYYICKYKPKLNKKIPIKSEIRNAVFYKIKKTI